MIYGSHFSRCKFRWCQLREEETSHRLKKLCCQLHFVLEALRTATCRTLIGVVFALVTRYPRVLRSTNR